MAKVATGRILEGTWQCPYCGRKGIPAITVQTCPGCGRAKPSTTEFDYSHTQEVHGKMREEAWAGADWNCSFCESLVRAVEKECPYCGHTREESDKNYFELQKERRKVEEERRRQESMQRDEKYYLDREDIFSDSRSAVDDDSQRNEYQRRDPLLNGVKYAVIALLGIMAAVGLITLFIPKNLTMNVQSVSWETDVVLENLELCSGTGWNLPSDAYNVEKEWRFKETIDVLDHYDTITWTEQESYQVQVGTRQEYSYEELGNGGLAEYVEDVPVYETRYKDVQKSRQEPVYRKESVYDWWYTYTVDRWKTVSHNRLSGYGHEVMFAEISTSGDRQRTRESVEYFVTDDEDKRWTAPKDVWYSIEPDTTITVKVDKILSIIKELVPEE